MDLDGFHDLAVGSPYVDDGRGAVFIHRGGSKGIDVEPSQIIRAINLDTKMRGLGFSLSGSNDLDGNNYPDLVAGAPYSGQTVFFRSRPVVRVDAQVRIETTDGLINPEWANCTLHSGSKVACVTIEGCLKYEGEAVDDRLDFVVTFTLDTKKKVSRLFFLNQEGSREASVPLQLNRNKRLCKRSYVYLQVSF